VDRRSDRVEDDEEDEDDVDFPTRPGPSSAAAGRAGSVASMFSTPSTRQGTPQLRQTVLEVRPKNTFMRRSQETFNNMVLAYLVRDVLPLTRSSRSEGFKALMLNAVLYGMNVGEDEKEKALDSLDHLKMPTEHTLKKLLKVHFLKCKEVVRRLLKNTKYVCTTTDGWTSRGKAFLGTTAHWIDRKTLKRRSACLGADRLLGRHTHKVLASKVYNVNKDFEILKNIVATVTDNASNFCAAFRLFSEVEEVDVDKDSDSEVEDEEVEAVEPDEVEPDEVDELADLFAENLDVFSVDGILDREDGAVRADEQVTTRRRGRGGRGEAVDVSAYQGESSESDDEETSK
jgi:hypothetical protein